MVAFIGAVICIIAAVHSGSPAAAAAQPLSENQSLSPDAGLQTFAPGSAARTGPLDTLRGTDVGSRESSGPEAPTFYGINGVGTRRNGEQVTYSRLICTPVPAGECKPRNVQQQAEDPSLYADEDWGYLRTTAEELRQTVLQQKDEIVSDQRTIRELTGKLSECEKDLGGRSVPAKSAGLWGGKRAERDASVMRDEGLTQVPNARAVEELEKAIGEMRERIEKLEFEMGPLTLNFTEAGQRGAGGLSGAPSRRVEELEGELKKKVQQLEKERRGLHLQSHNHQKHIDHGIGEVRQRLTRLEQGKRDTGLALLFPRRSDSMVVVVNRPVAELHAFTVCLWLQPGDVGMATPFSYAVPDQTNALALLLGIGSQSELIINDHGEQLSLNVSVGKWQHICVSWSRRGGVWHVYQDGKLTAEGKDLATHHSIRPAGTLTLGQKQGFLRGGFDPVQSLVGDLSHFNLWDHRLTHADITRLAHCSRGILGNVVYWNHHEMELFGGVTLEHTQPCRARQ
ncbi:neuronal pentraxin receptor a [Chanos chanos]|uniref:Neuronal pentraxin receptor a n=1 Tax=Chanos chanos TaxID=29144 RepID=A0A6J2WYG8_CHACN|nr:neuronal pentraxin-1-like [Chanos chanos]